MKKAIQLYILTASVLLASLAYARTNCDDQPKPALGCPTGYSMMCISAGGDHWGCGKEANGQIVEASSTQVTTVLQGGTLKLVTSSTDGVKSILQTQVRTATTGTSNAGLQVIATTTRTETNYEDTGRPALLRASTESAESTSSFQGIIYTEGDLKTLRARLDATGVVKKVEVRGWDPEKKEEIIGRPEKIETEDDLKIYIEAVALNDPVIKGIKIKENLIEVKSEEEGKLLWIFPVKITSIVTVNVSPDAGESDRVKIKFPWWSAFVKKTVDFTDVAAKFRTELDAKNEQHNLFQLQNIMSKYSQTLQMVSNIMKTKHDSAMSIIRNIK